MSALVGWGMVALIAGSPAPVSVPVPSSNPASSSMPSAAPPPPVVPPAPSRPQPRPAGSVYSFSADEGAALRRYGLGVVVGGVIVGLGGLIAAYHNPCGKDGARGSDCRSDIRNALGLTLGVTSLGMLTGGITAMAVGESLRRRGRLEAGMGLSLSREAGAVVLVGRF